MGITDFFTDVWDTFAHPSPDAEVQGGSSTKSPASGTDEESGAEAEVNKQDEKKGGNSQEQGHKPSGKGSDEGDDEEPEEEEEEEEEPDPKEKLEKGEFAGDSYYGRIAEAAVACELHDGLDEQPVLRRRPPGHLT
jgi:ubiquinol-cytochrome c reductase subunit 6